MIVGRSVDVGIFPNKDTIQKEVEKIKQSLPPMDFSPCPACGMTPKYHIQAWTALGSRQLTFDISLECCKFNHTSLSRYHKHSLEQLEHYADTDEFIDLWEKKREYITKCYAEYSSDDWSNKCGSCGKKYLGYEDMECIVMDGVKYCPECARKLYHMEEGKNGATFPSYSYYRVAHTCSSMFDGPIEYVTSLEKLSEVYEIPLQELHAKHFKRDPIPFNWGYGLTGHIDGEHWKVYKKGDKCEVAFIFEPSEDELSKLKGIKW